MVVGLQIAPPLPATVVAVPGVAVVAPTTIVVGRRKVWPRPPLLLVLPLLLCLGRYRLV